MKRFYVDIDHLSVDCIISLPKTVTHRLINVLRYRPGQSIVVFNGDGYDYLGNIESLNKQNTTVKITQQIEKANESNIETVLFMGVCKFDRMDWAIQKAVEIGVGQIIPVLCEYSQIKKDEQRFVKKKAHWQSIIVSACEQSGRSIIPQLNEIKDFNDVIKALQSSHKNSQKFVLHPYHSKPLLLIPNQSDKVVLAIGPEGGFSECEMDIFKQQQFNLAQIGKTILRAETAVIAALSLVHFK